MDSSDNREYQNLSHSYPTAKDAVTIRSFQRSDHKECLQICLDGWQEFIRNITLDVLSKSFWYVAIATVFTSLAAVLWSAWIFVVHVLIVFILCALFCIILQLSSWQLTNNWLRTDLKDIEKSYMSDEGSSHMWVAELHGKVVGMVGLIHNDSDGPGANELRRMYVKPMCRGMGIGEKMLIEVIAHAKRQKLEKIMLTTSTSALPAIRLYKKYGFKQTIGSPGQSVHTPGGIKESYRSIHTPGIKETGRSIDIPLGEMILKKVTDTICLEFYIYSAAEAL